jgi:hypothetical protein
MRHRRRLSSLDSLAADTALKLHRRQRAAVQAQPAAALIWQSPKIT